MTPEIGVIGGSGLYDMEGFTVEDRRAVSTPYGSPSSRLTLGELGSRSVVFLPRHGEDHSILPSEVNARANIFALKKLGVRRILVVGAVGSLQPERAPRELGIPDQILDFTRGRDRTFFGDGLVVHVSLADPFCPHLRTTVAEQQASCDLEVNGEGVYVCIEGPQFSTRAESRHFRSLEADYIGMTVMPEARLAREAEICYAAVGMITDYDAWKPDAAGGDPQVMLENLRVTAEGAKNLIRAAVGAVELERSCTCESALQGSLITSREAVPEARQRELQPLIGSYWPVE